MTMKKLQRKDKLVPSRQNNDLWVKVPSQDTELGQGQNLNEFELVQDEHLKTLETNKKKEQTNRQDWLGNNDHSQLSQLYRDTKTEKTRQLRREIEFLDRGMQRVRKDSIEYNMIHYHHLQHH